MFNMPMDMLTHPELEDALLDIPQLKLLHIESSENCARKEINLTLHQWLDFLSSATKPVMEAYLGRYKADELFTRIKAIASRHDNLGCLMILDIIMVAILQRV